MNLTTNVNIRSKSLPGFIVADNLFDDNELATITKYCEAKKTLNSEVFDRGTSTSAIELRKSKTAFHFPNQDNQWFFEKSLTVFERINRDFFGFDLIGYDSFQYTVYNESDFYIWHTDLPFGYPLNGESFFIRKLSASLILNDDFTGGEFEVMDEPLNPKRIGTGKGTMIFFPSFINHQVNKIITGTRKSIVFWALGPMFR